MKVSYHFVSVFYQLPPESFDALIQCAISALRLQERYSLVAASTFLVRSSLSPLRALTIFFCELLSRLRLSETPRRTTISPTQKGFSSTLTDGRSYAHCLLALRVSRQSQPFQTSSSCSRPSSPRCRWKASSGSLRFYTEFVGICGTCAKF